MEQFLSTRPEFTQPAPPRLTFLYSALAPRKTANPTGFNSAISWWNSLLLDATREGVLGEDRLSFTVREKLREGLRWPGVGRPSSLATVVSELSNQNQLISLERYLATNSSESNWIALLASPLIWSFTRLRASLLGESSSGENQEEALWSSLAGIWVFPTLVREAADRIIPELEGLLVDPLARLYTIKTLQTTINDLALPSLRLSNTDCLILVQHLSRTSPPTCIVQGELIKFIDPYTSTPLRITSSDEGILSLLSTLSLLALQITSLESQITAQQEIMRSYSVKKNVPMVRSALVRRQQLEGVLQKRVGSRGTLREVLWGIEKAVGDEATMTAITSATSTLRILISSPTLSLDNIDETTLALSSALADAEEINLAVSAPGLELMAATAGGEEGEKEVEDELRGLIEEVERDEREKIEGERKERESEERKRTEAEASEVARRIAKLKEANLSVPSLDIVESDPATVVAVMEEVSKKEEKKTEKAEEEEEEGEAKKEAVPAE